MVYISNRAALNQQLHKAENVAMFGKQIPIKPTRFVVVAVGVVVAALATPDFVAHNKHGHAGGQHQGRKKVLHLPVTKLLDFWVIRGAFKPAVPASVLLASVAVVLAVLFIVLVVIGD